MSLSKSGGSTDESPSAGKSAEGSLWGARFADGPSPELAALSRSTHFDWQLYPYDIAGSKAHAKALAKGGYLTEAELASMLDALANLQAKIEAGEFAPGRPPPSLNELMQEHACSIGTAHRAVSLLAAGGLVVTRRGFRVSVASPAQ